MTKLVKIYKEIKIDSLSLKDRIEKLLEDQEEDGLWILNDMLDGIENHNLEEEDIERYRK